MRVRRGIERAGYTSNGRCTTCLRPRVCRRGQVSNRRASKVDGAFECDQRYFLLEAKWHTKPVGLKELDAFHAKVERKLSGTLGVFISMSGYPRNAADSLLKAKALTILLFGEGDMDAVLRRDGRVPSGFWRRSCERRRNMACPYYEYKPLIVKPARMKPPPARLRGGK